MINSNRFFWSVFFLEIKSWCSCADFVYFMYYTHSLHTWPWTLAVKIARFIFYTNSPVFLLFDFILQRETAALESGKCLFKSSFMRQEFLLGSSWSISQSLRPISLPEPFRIIKSAQSESCSEVVSVSHCLFLSEAARSVQIRNWKLMRNLAFYGRH